MSWIFLSLMMIKKSYFKVVLIVGFVPPLLQIYQYSTQDCMQSYFYPKYRTIYVPRSFAPFILMIGQKDISGMFHDLLFFSMLYMTYNEKIGWFSTFLNGQGLLVRLILIVYANMDLLNIIQILHNHFLLLEIYVETGFPRTHYISILSSKRQDLLLAVVDHNFTYLIATHNLRQQRIKLET